MLHQRAFLHANVWKQDRMPQCSTDDERARSQHAVHDFRLAAGLPMDAASGRVLSFIGSDRPVSLLEIDCREGLQQVHVRLVIRIDRTDIAPIPVRGDSPARASEAICNGPVGTYY